MSTATAVEAARRCTNSVALISAGNVVAARCALYVVDGVSTLRTYASALDGALLVVDARERLATVRGLRVIDASARGDDWSPRAIRLSEIRRALHASERPEIAFVPDSSVDTLVERARSSGALHGVLHHASVLPTPERDRLHALVLDLLRGRIQPSTFRRRSAPRREAHARTHEEMCALLEGPRGLALGEAVRLTVRGVDVAEAAARTGADKAEVGYILFDRSKKKS